MSPGYIALQKLAAEYGTEAACPKCKNPEFSKLGVKSNAEFICDECGEEFFPDQTLKVNFFQDALRIWADKGYDTPRFEHIHILCDHAENLHLRVLELEELLETERRRLAAAQRVVDECGALTGASHAI